MHKRKLLSVAKKLDKASKAHAGQSKTLKRTAKKKGGNRLCLMVKEHMEVK